MNRDHEEVLACRNRRNPLLPPKIHIPDCEAHVMPDGRLYLYGSFDAYEDLYCSRQYRVASTADMENWTVHGIALRGEDIPWYDDPDAPKYPGIDWSDPSPFMRRMMEQEAASEDDLNERSMDPEEKLPQLLYAPDCIEKDGKYYLYFCMADDSEGVAVSDRPEGPFSDPVRIPVGGIDPAIFIDDDGRAYYYWGQMYPHGARLNEDMKSIEPGSVRDRLVTEEAHFFHEGSSMRKIGDTYYLVYADMERGKPTALGYATSNSPLGPFTYRGIIIDNDGCDPETWNNHGSIACFQGQWYVFYHRSSRGGKLHRRVCAEKIRILPDGSIPEVLMTSQGAGDPFAPGERIEAYRACGLTGTVRLDAADASSQQEEKLTGISDGDTAIFRYVESSRPFERIRMTASGSGTVKVYFGGKLAGTVRIGNGCGEQPSKAEASISAPAGLHELCLEFEEAEALEIFDLTLE